LNDSVRVEVAYQTAVAQVFLGEDAAGCGRLRDALPTARAVRYLAAPITHLLDTVCD
jgi:hypothetical protein